MLVTDTATKFMEEMLVNTELFDRKHQDYGPGNINKLGFDGVLARIDEKLERIKHLSKKGGTAATGEPMEDSLRDISNLATIALMFKQGNWPKE